jgi:hypothetical protein
MDETLYEERIVLTAKVIDAAVRAVVATVVKVKTVELVTVIVYSPATTPVSALTVLPVVRP